MNNLPMILPLISLLAEILATIVFESLEHYGRINLFRGALRTKTLALLKSLDAFSRFVTSKYHPKDIDDARLACSRDAAYLIPDILKLIESYSDCKLNLPEDWYDRSFWQNKID